jgi:hypothetical protein
MKPNFLKKIKSGVTLSIASLAILTMTACFDTTGNNDDNGDGGNPSDSTNDSSVTYDVILQNETNGYFGTYDAIIAMKEYLNLTDGDLDSSTVGKKDLNYGENAFLGSHFCPT